MLELLDPFLCCRHPRLTRQHLVLNGAEVVSADHRHLEQLVAALIFLFFDPVLGLGLLKQGLAFLQTVIKITAIHHRQNLVRLHHIAFIHQQCLEKPLLAGAHVHLLDRL